MEFSEPFQVAGPVAYSPDGVLVAAIVDGMRVAVRQAETLRVVRVCECCDLVQHIEWSGDSKHLLCAQLLRARVWVFSISADASSDLVQAPVAKIDEGVCGLSWARFAPDGAHVLTCSQFNIRLTIWDLASRHHRYIENPKNPEKALDFDAEGKLLAVSHRRTFKDYIHLYATENWTQIATWEAGTTNLVGLAFAPNGAFLCAWDGPLYYNVCVYAVPKGERLMAYSAYEDALAIKSVQWTPNSMLLAIGSYDQRVRIVNYLTWKVVCELSHLAGAVNTPTVAVYIESRSGATDSSQYVLGKVPFSVPEVVADPDRDASAKFGVGLMEWCPNSDYLATRNDNQPTCVYVWMTKTLSLACVLVHLAPVRAITWSRTRTQLLIVTDSSRLFTWTPGGAACVTIPADGFQATGCLTNPCQDSFVVWDRSQAVAGFIDDERYFDSGHRERFIDGCEAPMSDRLSLSESANNDDVQWSGLGKPSRGLSEETVPSIIPPITSQPFVKWTLLQDRLERFCSEGIRSFMLIKADGSPILFAGNKAFSQVMSGLLAQIWMTFDLDGREALGSSTLELQQITFSKGALITCSVSSFLLTAVIDQDAQLAWNKRRVLALKAHLQGPLSKVV